MRQVEKIWTIRGLESGRFLEGWYSFREDGSCPIGYGDLQFQMDEWGENAVIQLGYGVIKDGVGNVGIQWFYETKEEAEKDLEEYYKGR